MYFEYLARSICNKNGAYTPAGDYGIAVAEAISGNRRLGKDVELCITNQSEQIFTGVLQIQGVISSSNPKFFLPGYMYNRNTADRPRAGRKRFPRITLWPEGCPESSFFLTRSDRLALPVGLIWDPEEGKTWGLSADPYLRNEDAQFQQFCGFGCAMLDRERASISYTIGYENAPWLFIQTATVLEREELSEINCISLSPGQELRVVLHLYEYTCPDERGIHEALQDTYELYHEAPRKVADMTIKRAVKLLSSAVKDYAWLPQDKCYSCFVFDRPEGLTYNKLGSLTWTNGLAVAVPMLCASGLLQDEELRRQALTFIEEVVAHSMNPESGLPYDAYTDGQWGMRGWWYDGLHNGGHGLYLTGQAAYYILKAYEQEKPFSGTEHPEWLDYAGRVVEKVNTLFNTDMEYPFVASGRTGAGLEYDSMGSVWCLAASAYYVLLSGNWELLSQLILSETHYYEQYVSKFECYGGPLDTDKAVDSEGVLAYVRAVRLLHMLTGEEKYLDHLREGLWYEFSFKLGYNTPVQVRPLSEIGWSSCGGSITSVANPHIHPMSSTVVEEMFYYLSYREDAYVRSRLEDTLGWGLQTFNTYDKEYGYGYTGWMSERFCFCEGLVTEKYPDGMPAGTWFALMPWASASLVEGFMSAITEGMDSI